VLATQAVGSAFTAIRFLADGGGWETAGGRVLPISA